MGSAGYMKPVAFTPERWQFFGIYIDMYIIYNIYIYIYIYQYMFFLNIGQIGVHFKQFSTNPGRPVSVAFLPQEKVTEQHCDVLLTGHGRPEKSASVTGPGRHQKKMSGRCLK